MESATRICAHNGIPEMDIKIIYEVISNWFDQYEQFDLLLRFCSNSIENTSAVFQIEADFNT